MDGVSFDPINGFLSQNHWNALVVEPLPDMFEKLKKNYTNVPSVQLANVAVSTHNGIVKMYRIDPSKLTSESIPDWAKGISSLHKDRNALGGKGVSEDIYSRMKEFIVETEVPSVILPQLLLDYQVSKIDVLVVDTEGHDYQIVKQLDFKAISPRLIIIEWVNLPIREKIRLFKLFKENSYDCYIEGIDLVGVKVL